MRIGIRNAISGLVLTSIVVSAACVHLLWWRTAQQVSQTLAETINDQIVSAVGDELQSITTEARSAMIAMRTLFTENVLDTRDSKKREFVFLSQLQAQPTISWVAFGWPDGSFYAGHKLGDSAIEMLGMAAGDRKLRIDEFEYAGTSIQLKTSRVVDSSYAVTDQDWYRGADQSNDERWSTLTTHPVGERPAAALAAPIDVDGTRVGVLAIIIELTRVSNFLSQLTVGKSAGAFILDRDGAPIVVPDPDADELNPQKLDHPLLPVAVDALRQCRRRLYTTKGQAFRTNVTRGGLGYEAVLTPISFPGWSLVTVIPSSNFSAGARHDPKTPDWPCDPDRCRRRTVGVVRAAPGGRAADQGGQRDQACRALRPRQGPTAFLAAIGNRELVRRHRRHGERTVRLRKIFRPTSSDD